MHFVFALPGLHRFGRGAEVVFESIGQEIAAQGEHKVTLIGSGQPRAGQAYDFVHIPAVSRERFERWPKMPFLRHEFMYEEATFAARLAFAKVVGTADVTLTCSYPYVSWALRRPRSGKRPPQVFVTQNGDWGPQQSGIEPRLFYCEGLICTNPLYLERNKARWHSTLIPNGVDPQRFCPGPPRHSELGLPTDRKIVLMVSALEPGKRVLEAIYAMADVPDAMLVVAGDGPLRDEVDRLSGELLPGRFHRATFRHDQMPDLYRSADLFLHTKIRESFGNVYIEALSCGTAIVAHDDEVTRWILEDKAMLVDTNKSQLLSAAITQGLSSTRSNSAVAWAHSRYAWNVVAGQYAEFLSNVARRNG